MLLITVSIIFAVISAQFGSLYVLFPALFITAVTTVKIIEKRNRLIETDYYGVGREFWEESEASERAVYRNAYCAALMRENIEMLLKKGTKNQTKLKWALYKLDNHFG